MVITFDPAKRAQNLRDRRLDFLDAEVVLSGPVFTVEDTRLTMAKNVFKRLDFSPTGW
jgi:uncharacterized DUF497 family protein